MPDAEPIHTNRARAESFGAVAADYDRYRPDYPAPLIDDLVALHPANVLDVGCGTGKAARQLTARGLDVLGVEVDPQMAAVARSHGLSVVVSSFEEWDDAGRQFDLIISAQAWHWVQPRVGAQKAARLLRPNGTLVVFWNHYLEHPNDLQARFDAVYREHAPELLEAAQRDRERRGARPYFDDLKASGAFRRVQPREYPYQRRYTAAEWVGNVQTHSDHLLLDPARRSAGSALPSPPTRPL